MDLATLFTFFLFPLFFLLEPGEAHLEICGNVNALLLGKLQLLHDRALLQVSVRLVLAHRLADVATEEYEEDDEDG